ncbi:MAG: gliding motility lipoprotein GldH [Bacteroidales bacterium]|nr:gliding motility lipoprotein GldH [Bacteroidales bacterium]
MKRFLLILSAALMLFATSCRRGVFYEEILPVKNETWSLNDTLHFAFDITDTLQYYTIYMDIRNSIDFETRNLYLFMDTEDPHGTKSRDTLEFLLADAHGNWVGKGTGRLKDYQYLFYPKVRFPYSGTYKFSFVQAMRTERLEGVANFGITLYYFDENRFRR